MLPAVLRKLFYSYEAYDSYFIDRAGRGSSAVSVDNESNIEEEIAELRREIATKRNSKQGEIIRIQGVKTHGP